MKNLIDKNQTLNNEYKSLLWYITFRQNLKKKTYFFKGIILFKYNWNETILLFYYFI